MLAQGMLEAEDIMVVEMVQFLPMAGNTSVVVAVVLPIFVVEQVWQIV